jgi:threonine/homoserine efflux transporter RhtA
VNRPDRPSAADQRGKEQRLMMILSLQPVFALLAGILILVVPRSLNYIVAVYLILSGILGLAHRL